MAFGNLTERRDQRELESAIVSSRWQATQPAKQPKERN
jgi:hypothetical protein